MQNLNYEQSGNQGGQGQPNPKDKNRWLIILGLLLLALIIYKIFCAPETPPGTKTTDVTFDPENAGVTDDSLGNRDGQINPDEQVKFRLRLTNTGKTTIASFDLVLTAQDSGVILIDNRVHFNSIDSGKSALSEDPFEFKMPRRFIPPCVTFHGKAENVKQAGLIGEALANIPEHDVDVTLPVAPNYRVCVISCTLQDNNNTEGTPDILAIDLMLCNASLKPSAETAGAVLSDASITIHTSTLKACKAYIVAAPPEVITATSSTANDILYGNVAAGACNSSASSFTFQVPASWAQSVPPVQNPTLCIHFTAELFSNSSSSSTSKTSYGFAFVGVNARVNRSTSTPVAIKSRRR